MTHDEPVVADAKMSWPEWLLLAAQIDAWWPATDFTEDSERAYYVELAARFTAEQVEAAIRECLLEGSDFAPSLGKVLKKLDVPEDEVPTFEQVMNRVQWASRAGDEASAIRRLTGEHALILDWVQSYGFARLMAEPVDDPDHGGATLHRLKKAWEAHVDTWRARQQRGATRAQLGAASANRELESTGGLRPVVGSEAVKLKGVRSR